MKKDQKNYAFIDSQNLNLGIKGCGWLLDWKKFRVYLREKYGVTQAYMFMGYIEGNEKLYQSLQENHFTIIFKPTLRTQKGVIKGNCNAELVLQAMIDFDKYNKAIIVSGDGDFSCLVRYLAEQEKLERVLVPKRTKYSCLLRKPSQGNIAFVSDLRRRLEFQKNKKELQ